MKDFKFFKGSLNIIDVDVRATASFNDDTPEGHMNRRMLYHTDRNLYNRFSGLVNETHRPRLGTPERHQDILRRLQITNEARDLNDNPIRLFQTASVTTVKETFWTKFKDVMRESWRVEPVAVVVASVLTTLVVTVGIAKLIGL
jgi:hypothetical protein